MKYFIAYKTPCNKPTTKPNRTLAIKGSDRINKAVPIPTLSHPNKHTNNNIKPTKEEHRVT